MRQFALFLPYLFFIFPAWAQQVDLHGQVVYMSQEEMYAGEVVVVRSLVSNRGTESTPQNTQILAYYYLSKDALWDSTDIYLGDNQINSELEAGGSFEEIIRIFTLPDDCPSGIYFLLYVMDPENTIAEAREDNNLDVKYPFTVKKTRPNGIELIGLISNIEEKYLHPGNKVGARSYVRNIGTTSTPLDSGFLTFYLLCPDSNWNDQKCMRIGGEYFGDPFVPGMQVFLDEDLTIPDTLSPGKYSLWYQVDVNNDIPEFDEDNNLSKWGMIEVSIPWYLRWWAMGVYIFLGGVVGTSLWRFSIRQREIKRTLREADRIREIEQFKSRFYTNITHEFRTPLTIILGMVHELRQGGRRISEENFQHHLRSIENSGQSLLMLVNQLLELAKVESDTLMLHPIQADIIPFLEYVYVSFDSYAESKELTYSFNPEVETLVMDYDPVYLHLIISNLLSNAIKFTPNGGAINLAVQKSLESTNDLILIVEDTGVGIANDQRERIFERFYQIDNSSTRSQGGTGIGLALTKELLQIMEGRIEVQSKLGEGSKFVIHLPVSCLAEEQVFSFPNGFYAPTELSTRPLLQNEGISEAEILIVEDHQAVVEYLEVCLKDKYNIQVALNGLEGFDKAVEKVPDLIISDVMMPEMNGLELCDKLKTDIRTSHIPVILLTAKVTQEDKLHGLSRGADAYLTKPFNKDELLIRIHQLLLLRKRLHQRYETLQGLNYQEEKPHLEDEFLKKLQSFVEEDISNSELSVPHICQLMGMSHTQLHRKVKALTGKSISRFVRFVRLKKGRQLLKESHLGIAEIAYDVGFKDPNYFSRTFSEEFGSSPTEVRDGK